MSIRLASVAMDTDDIDCVYHIANPEMKLPAASCWVSKRNSAEANPFSL
ncbi:MAG: hypothetical protein JRI72_04075 [Deltaproteobacteria bacterium]|nr:hypothetical protein [Deltaproteobacteria bacterium]